MLLVKFSLTTVAKCGIMKDIIYMGAFGCERVVNMMAHCVQPFQWSLNINQIFMEIEVDSSSPHCLNVFALSTVHVKL